MEVFVQRLEQEYGAQPVVTAPGVTYKAKIFGAKNITKYQGDTVTFNNPADFPDRQIVDEFYEPMIVATILTPGTCVRVGVSFSLDSIRNLFHKSGKFQVFTRQAERLQPILSIYRLLTHFSTRL